MAAIATQKTPEQAATCIQARVRGIQYRRQHAKVVKGITKLQAYQRGRFTRRAYAQLQVYHSQQSSLLEATKRRQQRIWKQEQELYFLRHTTAEQLEQVYAFQRKRSAACIQRAWKQKQMRQQTIPITKSPTNRPGFDPFQFFHDPERFKAAMQSPWNDQERMRALLLHGKKPAEYKTAIPSDNRTERRQQLLERIQQKCKKQQESERIPTHSITKRTTAPQKRQELYQKLCEAKQTTYGRLQAYTTEIQAKRASNQTEIAAMVTSCANRLKELREKHSDLLKSNWINASDMHEWSPKRQAMAWHDHIQTLTSINANKKWYQTVIAGEERDIRSVHAISPWEHDRKVWLWPYDPEPPHRETTTVPVDTIVHQLMQDGDYSSNQKRENAMSDEGASEWWRAHCTQPYLLHLVDNNNENEAPNRVITQEVVANPSFYRLVQDTKRKRLADEQRQAIEAMERDWQTQTNQLIYEMETQMEVNTQLQLQLLQRKQAKTLQVTKEQKAAVQIQRHIRGVQGRKQANEVRAEFFVMVRGRAIRKGKCEECGDQRAVLECHECEENGRSNQEIGAKDTQMERRGHALYFCPQCWVHVHSTRRRKHHAAIPMVHKPIETQATVRDAVSRPPQHKQPVKKKESKEPKTPVQLIGNKPSAATEESVASPSVLSKILKGKAPSSPQAPQVPQASQGKAATGETELSDGIPAPQAAVDVVVADNEQVLVAASEPSTTQASAAEASAESVATEAPSGVTKPRENPRASTRPMARKRSLKECMQQKPSSDAGKETTSDGATLVVPTEQKSASVAGRRPSLKERMQQSQQMPVNANKTITKAPATASSLAATTTEAPSAPSTNTPAGSAEPAEPNQPTRPNEPNEPNEPTRPASVSLSNEELKEAAAKRIQAARRKYLRSKQHHGSN